MVAATPVATVISDPRLPDNPIIAVNQTFIDLTGYGADEVLDRNCRFLSGAGTEPWLTEKIREGARDHHPVLVEILNYKKCGTPFRNAVLVAPIYDDADELIYFLGTQIEISSCEQSISENRRERAVALLRQLTPRQLEVTKLVAKGLLNKQIAAVLGLSIKTVKMHRSLVMSRLELRTQADLIRLAVEGGV
ncbi:MAG: LuxR C-terminal-related transcriptional regulator [Parasphingorhabdus sp.]|nr:LuxR C-terminal-related transcriptional regulator [Parasphingorhabdus sp.]